MNVSEVLKQSVAEMHERLRAERATPFEAVRSLGLVGAYAGGDPDASSRVKETVAATVAKKARPLKRQ
jgi:hypothetical protein